jgi:membrane fusion protein (multidrug efflux system)
MCPPLILKSEWTKSHITESRHEQHNFTAELIWGINMEPTLNQNSETTFVTPHAGRKTFLRRVLVIFVVAVIIVVVGIYAAPKLLYYFSHESTDNAYVTGTVVPISAEVKGRVVKVYVDDNQLVKAGSPLLEIYREDYADVVRQREEDHATLIAQEAEIQASINEKKKSLEQARANLEAAMADEELAKRDFERSSKLLREAVLPQSQFDQADAQLKVAKTRIEAARAAVAEVEASIETLTSRLKTQSSMIKQAEVSLNLAKLDLQRTTVSAPISGRIAQKNVDAGKYVLVGQPLLALVDENDVWIVANYKETQIARMRIGQPVDIMVDAYRGIVFKGKVDSFQPGTGSVFSLLPPDNATGNFVKVVQRLPVKIVFDSPFDPAHPLWPGLSVVPHVDITGKTGAKLKDLRGDGNQRNQ